METLLARFPWIEVLARLIYWRLPPARYAGDRLRSILAKRRRPQATPAPLDPQRLLAAIRALGVREGDLLVVHSSYGELKRTGLSPAGMAAALKDLLGESGTLVMPTIPDTEHEPQGGEKFHDAAYERVFDYDVANPKILTGALPRALMQTPGAVRSRYPGNAMTALGPLAEPMMAKNLEGDAPTPCGPNSSWRFCYEHDAGILALGIDLVHSLTMIHVAEDAFEEEWPVAGWYRRRRFRVRDGAFEREITVRERKHGWSNFYAERAFSRDLHRDGVAQAIDLDGLELHFCRSRALVDYLRARRATAYPYVFPLGFPRTRAA